MKLKLNKSIINRIELATEPSKELFTDINNIIHDLERLYDAKKISDEELKEIIKKYYSFELEFYTSNDMERISKSILRKGEVDYVRVDTSIITEVIKGGELSYLCAVIYLPTNCEFDFEHIYTSKELEKLITERKIVLESLDFRSGIVPLDEILLANLDEEKKFDTISLYGIDENNFGLYEDILLSHIKLRLTPEKVNRDILRIINSMRTLLNKHSRKLERNIWDLELQNNQNKAIEAEFIEYKEQLLSRRKK